MMSSVKQKKAVKSVFFEVREDRPEDDCEYTEWDGVEIRACQKDEDYPMEISVELKGGWTFGVALTRDDVRRFVTEAYSSGAV